GSYVCKLNISGVEVVSDPIAVQLEGLPHFIRQPEKLNVTRNSPFNLTCQAVGPPEPVEIYWFRNNVRLNEKPHISPSVLTVPGEPCASLPRPAGPPGWLLCHLTARPLGLMPPVGLGLCPRALSQGCCNLFCLCVKEAVPQNNASLLLFSTAVPPHLYHVPQLQPMVGYDVRVSCGNEVGWSAFSPWMTTSTTE
ncbi:MERTK kinase, partial [Columbina picui]|nr:MERTK kinase [Columbina picui]